MKVKHSLFDFESFFSMFQKQELLFHPAREWVTGLFLGTFLFCASVFFIGLDFYNQFYIPQDAVEVAPQTIEYHAREVRTYAEKYQVKEDAFMKLRNNSEFIPVPLVKDVVPAAATTSAPVVEANDSNMVPLADDGEDQ